MPQPDSDQQRQLKITCMNNLLAATQERVYFKDQLSRFLFVSDGWIAAYAPGHTPEELAGKTDFDIFTHAHAYAARQDEQHIMRTGQPITGKVECETHKGRPDTWVSTTKMPLRDETGQIIGTFGITRDITAQVKSSLPPTNAGGYRRRTGQRDTQAPAPVIAGALGFHHTTTRQHTNAAARNSAARFRRFSRPTRNGGVTSALALLP
jgi:PAS domain S-box-containing protein